MILSFWVLNNMVELKNMSNKQNLFYYGWIIVAVSFLTLFFSIGIRVSFGVYYVAILDGFGWSRASTAFAYSLAMCVHAIFAPVSGYLIDRFSPRRLFPVGAAFLATGLILCSYINSKWQLYLFWGVFTAIGINMTGFAPNMTIVPRWFIKKKGMANGIAASGIGTGSLIVAMISGLIIKTWGWRIAFLINASAVCLIIIPAAAIFLRRSPQEIGLCPDNDATQKYDNALDVLPKTCRAPSGNIPDRPWTLRMAAKTAPFWWINLTAACHGYMVSMMVVHQAMYIVDAGFSPLLAASILGITGGLGSFGNTFFGAMSDRIGRKGALALGSLLAFSGMFCFLFVKCYPLNSILYLFTFLYGIGLGAYSPIYASSMADLYTGPSFGKIIATVSVAYGIGGAFSSYAGGYLYDKSGSYMLPFITLMICILLGAFGIWKASPEKNRQKYQLLNT
jgi:MFS family permease